MTSETNASDRLPLSGIRVIEFCQTIMGPTCGLVLADMGADVIKLEPAPAGDKTRRLYGFAAGFFPSFNRNKRSVALDLKSDEGRALAHKLIESADVAIENYAPGTMERLGCGYDTLSKINPRLIYCAMKGFLSGPYEDRPALDEVVQFMAGLAYMTGPPGRPLRAGASIIDILGGTYGAMGILAARPGPHRQGAVRQERAVRIDRAADDAAHGRRGGHRRGDAADAEPPGRLGRVRGVRHRGRRPDLHRHHQRPALETLLRGVRASGPAGRPETEDE
jgi:crotonobetainyl-CoA:carnitine CoA-transferase CaiB-like acyl-CoA transferase